MRVRIARIAHRPPAARRGHRVAPRAAGTRPQRQPEDRVREAGGPVDRARYQCSCGYQFDADVTTSVACPHCGTGQAW